MAPFKKTCCFVKALVLPFNFEGFFVGDLYKTYKYQICFFFLKDFLFAIHDTLFSLSKTLGAVIWALFGVLTFLFSRLFSIFCALYTALRFLGQLSFSSGPRLPPFCSKPEPPLEALRRKHTFEDWRHGRGLWLGSTCV